LCKHIWKQTKSVHQTVQDPVHRYLQYNTQKAPTCPLSFTYSIERRPSLSAGAASQHAATIRPSSSLTTSTLSSTIPSSSTASHPHSPPLHPASYSPITPFFPQGTTQLLPEEDARGEVHIHAHAHTHKHVHTLPRTHTSIHTCPWCKHKTLLA